MAGLTDLLGGISPIGAGISVASQIFNTIKGAKANKDNQNLLRKQMEENQADYNNTANKSFLDTNVAKNQVKMIDQQSEKARKDVAGRAAITGASDEAIVAGNSKVQENVNNATSNLAAQATEYQDNQKRMYLGRKDNLNAMQMQINQQKADNAANAVGNASDLFGTLSFNKGMEKPNTGSTPVSGSLGGISPEGREKLNAMAKNA